jgi:Fe-S oxidoreductase
MEDQYIEDLKEMILDTVRRCRHCNYCYSDCPLFESTRGFVTQGPSGLMTSIYYGIRWNLLEGKDGEDLRDILYACTTCGSCELRCKKSATNTPIVEVIEAGRKLLLEKMIGPLVQQRTALESIYKYGNPYGELPEKRLAWLSDTKVKRLKEEKAEVLYYVGCTASYEPELHNVARSLVKILQLLEVDFGILEAETCCGDPVRTLGDEVLFQELIGQNLEKFRLAGVKTIVTTSPHCFNAFLKKYENFDKEFEVKHYTSFLAQAFEQKKPSFKKQFPHTITYHDPCYLGKRNGIYDPPRALLKAIPGVKLVEMEMTREDSLCCGGGGGRMYAEVEEEKRLADTRLGHALEAGADVIATACPWCHIMLQNSARDLQMEDKIKVRDIAELLVEALGL